MDLLSEKSLVIMPLIWKVWTLVETDGLTRDMGEDLGEQPAKRKTPNTKLQTPNKLQYPTSKILKRRNTILTKIIAIQGARDVGFGKRISDQRVHFCKRSLTRLPL